MRKKTLSYFRLERNLTQAQLAKKVGVTERCVRKWEDNKEFLRNARVKNIIKLCKVLQISIDELI